MARVVDSGVLIDLERQGRTVEGLPEAWLAAPIYVTTISISELLIGLHRARIGSIQLRRRSFIEAVIKRLTVLPFDLEAARVHAVVASDLITRGQQIGVNDTLIAAIALTHECAVVTTNSVHFSRVPGLVVERPAWSE